MLTEPRYQCIYCKGRILFLVHDTVRSGRLHHLPYKSTFPFFSAFVFLQNTQKVGHYKKKTDKLLTLFTVPVWKQFSPLLQPRESPQASQLLQITSVGSKLSLPLSVKTEVSTTKALLYLLTLDYPQQLSHFVDDYKQCTYWQPQDCVIMATLRLIGWWQGVQSPRKLQHHLLILQRQHPVTQLSNSTANKIKFTLAGPKALTAFIRFERVENYI